MLETFMDIVCDLIGYEKMIFVKTFLRYLSLMSDVRFTKILFYYVEWQEAYHQLQYDIREKELEEQNWGCSNTKAKKSIIEFCEGLPYPEDYSNPLSPKLVIIGDLREKNRHRATQSWIFSPKAVIAKSLLLQNLFHQRRVQRYIV